MKNRTLTLLFAVLACSCSGQGLVKFSNNGSTLITLYNAYGNSRIMPPNDGSSVFYFALLTAPLGTTDPLAFTFAGIYATNTTTTTGGRIQGGSNLGVAVAGWAAGESRAFEVAGWSANNGYIWNPAWLSQGLFWGMSAIGQGFAGGTDSLGASIPAMAVFGAAPSITRGFVLDPGPEPSTVSLVAVAMFIAFLSKHSRKEPNS